jgi:rare lipoprotein A
MQDRAPPKTDNKRATGIAVASIAALLLAVALAQAGVLAPPDLETPRGDPQGGKAAAPQPLPAATAPTAPKPEPAQTGKASWYDFDGKETANGEVMDAERLTAAHPTLPFGTELKVENLENGRIAMVRVNDRGPYAGDRIIDVSKGAANKLDMIEEGVTEVNVAPVPTDSVDDPGEPIE